MIRRAGFECPGAEKGGGKEMDSLSHQLGKLGLTSHLKRRGIKGWISDQLGKLNDWIDYIFG